MKYTDEDVIAFNSHLEQEPLTAIAVSMIVIFVNDIYDIEVLE